MHSLIVLNAYLRSHGLKTSVPETSASEIPSEMPEVSPLSCAVDDSLSGYAMLRRDVTLLKDIRAVVRNDYKEVTSNVQLVAGCGAGMEPAYTGYVGRCMLTAAVVGDLFACPKMQAVLEVLRELSVHNSTGILLFAHARAKESLIFALATQYALNENLRVKLLVVGGDQSTLEPPPPGMKQTNAGVVPLLKIAGAMAECGKSLDEIHSVCSRVAKNVSTVAICYRPSTFPHDQTNDADVDCHSPRELVLQGTETLDHMIKRALGAGTNWYRGWKGVVRNLVVMINNLGGMSKEEEYIFVKRVLERFDMLCYSISRLYVGSFVTVCDMRGFSITILKVYSSALLRCLDFPTTAVSWISPRSARARLGKTLVPAKGAQLSYRGRPVMTKGGQRELRRSPSQRGPTLSPGEAHALELMVVFMADTAVACKEQADWYDSDGGDADCGSALQTGGTAIKWAVTAKLFDYSRPAALLALIADGLMSNMQGVCGMLFSVFFTAAGKAFEEVNPATQVTAETWLAALVAGTAAVCETACTEVGDSNLVDTLTAAQNVLAEQLSEYAHVKQTEREPLRKQTDMQPVNSCSLDEIEWASSCEGTIPDVDAGPAAAAFPLPRGAAIGPYIPKSPLHAAKASAPPEVRLCDETHRRMTSTIRALKEAAQAAEKAAEMTRLTKPQIGGCNAAALNLGLPDAGAYAVGVMFRALYEGMRSICIHRY